MDFISHALMGKIISLPQKSKKSIFWIIFFSVLPDIPLIPFYFILGYENNRKFFIPLNSDWTNASLTHPFLTVFSEEIFHSFLFAFLIILPLILVFKLPKAAFLAYFIHIIVDIPTHTNQWAIKPFYPFSFSFSGFTDAWAWPIKYIIISWIILLIIIIVFNIFLKLFFKNKNSSKIFFLNKFLNKKL